jgi:hypothetical protein
VYNVSYPFILRNTSQLDFGSGWDDGERFGHTDLLDAEITVGRRVQVDLASWGEFTYRITRIDDFAELAQRSAVKSTNARLASTDGTRRPST